MSAATRIGKGTYGVASQTAHEGRGAARWARYEEASVAERSEPVRADPSSYTISPAARAILRGAPFGRLNEERNDLEVEAIYRSGSDPLADVIIVLRHDCHTGEPGHSRTAIQVRDLEALIAADEIGFIFGYGALHYNRKRGWPVPENEEDEFGW